LQLNGGNPVVSYASAGLKLIVCDDPICSSKTVRILDASVQGGTDVSMRLSSSGNPVISYYDEDNGNLKLIVCNNPTCAP
jgi:hypothetical protein